MKNILLLLIISFEFCPAQIDISNTIKPRIAIINDQSKIDKSSYVILNEKDTLFIYEPNKMVKLDYLNESNYKDKSMLQKYAVSIFYFTNKHSNRKYYLRQWSSPVLVYFDKRIPKKTIKSFKTFFEPINQLDNFHLSYTNDIDEANYVIKLTDKEYVADPNTYNIKDKEDIKRYVFNNAHYKLIWYGNYKMIGGILEIQQDNLDSPKVFDKIIKQAFFLSLGRFFLSSLRKFENSLLNPVFKGTLDTINDFDLNLLMIHYSNIYDQRIDGSDFQELMELANNK